MLTTERRPCANCKYWTQVHTEIGVCQIIADGMSSDPKTLYSDTCMDWLPITYKRGSDPKTPATTVTPLTMSGLINKMGVAKAS